MRTTLLTALVLLLLLPHGAVADSSSTQLLDLRTEFIRLRNRGPVDGTLNEHASDAGVVISSTADSPTAWRRLGSKLELALREKRGFSDAGGVSEARVTLDAAEIRLRLWLALGSQEDLQRALELLAPLAAAEPLTQLGATAALLRGDAGVYAGEDRAAVRGHYERARSFGSGIGERAAQRLVSLDRGTFDHFRPSLEMEAPRAFFANSLGIKAPPLVVLDPGHGGDDAGALGPLGLAEKELTLEISQRVQELLNASGEVRVVLTRDEDRFVPLYQRTALANRLGALTFVSVHLNATPSHELSGLEAYYLDNTDDKASRRLAERENGETGAGDSDDLAFILSDLIQSGKLEDSIHLTRVLEESVRMSALVHHPASRSLGVKKAPFYVLVGAHMPCSLLELLFIDNPSDAEKLRDPAFRETLAQSVAEGVLRFVRGDRAHTNPTPARSKQVRASM